MRLPATQSLTDGELFWIIEHGVRFTGMPGWSTGTRRRGGQLAAGALFATCRTLQRPSWRTWRSGIRVHLKKSVKTSKPSGFFVARTFDEGREISGSFGLELYCYGERFMTRTLLGAIAIVVALAVPSSVLAHTGHAHKSWEPCRASTVLTSW